MTEGITLQHFLIISSIMFFAGIFGFIIRHNLITMLMSVELILNAVNINFIAFNYFLHPERMHGLFFSLIVVGIAAAEASVAIALIINVYRRFSTITVEDVSEMKY